jgi:hypothetical protein
MRKIFQVALASVALTGCASQGTNNFNYTPSATNHIDNEIQVTAPYSQVWDKLVRELSKSYFVINNIDKESRILNLSFTTTEPTEYADCGRSHRTYTRGDQVENFDYPLAGSSVTKIALKNNEGPAFFKYAVIKRDVTLEGRTNVYLAPMEEDKNKTIVTVNTRYVLQVKINQRAYSEHFLNGNLYDRGEHGDAITYAFNTNQPVEKTSEGLTTKCAATGKMEKDILGLVK